MTPDDLTRTSPPDATRSQADAALDAGLAVAFAPDDTRARPPSADPEAGTVVGGKYKLTEKLGEGGMGAVWAATQTEPVKRKVAVKLIKAGMDSKAVLARFDAERQALAVMDHPSIAKVLDGGVHAGRPYFVMELVKGVPITQFCDERKLTPAQRLELFVPVCQAIQHAHQKGVIHRDIKPSNVLVALYDDKPVPKVIDFGVAKATGAALTEHTLETAFGSVLGTPAYMSPEQASLNNLDIDTRSDVYSLGVLLYELLTGTPPFSRKELEQKGLFELFRVLREEEPPRPSAKLSTAETLPSIAATRSTEPKALTGLLRNELDWIVMKALEKDRARRYETANGFAADVLRFLAGEPVQAHPPTAAYRLRKFVRKHQAAVLVSAVVAVAAVAGLAGGGYGWVKAGHERTADRLRVQAESARDMAEAAGREAEHQRASATAAWREVELQRDKLAVFEYGRAVQLAYEAWRDNRLADARLLLADADPRLRGWEWRLVHRLCHADLLTLETPKGVGAVAVSPDGKTIVTGGRDGHLVLWDAATGGMKSTLRKDLREVHGVAFDPTGKRLLTTSQGTQTARVLDAETGADLVVIDTTAHGLFPPAAAFSPDGRRVIVSTTDGAKVVDAADGRLLLTLGADVKHGISKAVAFNHDGSRVATYDGVLVRVWDAATGKRLHSLPTRPGSMASGSWFLNGPTSVNFSPDGERLVASSEGVVWVWPAAGGEPVVLQGRSVGATAAAFSPDGSRAATAGADGIIRVWDPKVGVELAAFKGHAGAASTVAFTPDGKRLVSGGDAGRVWDLGGRDYAVSVKRDLIRAAAFSPDGTRFATAGERGPVTVWDARTGAERLAFNEHRSWVQAVAFSPDGTRAVSGGLDERSFIWDTQTGAVVHTLKGHSGYGSVAFSRDGARVLTSGADARLWDANTGAHLRTVPESGGGVQRAALSPDGTRVATAEWTGLVRLWDADTGAEVARLKGHPKPAVAVAVAFSPDGTRLVAGHDDGTVRVWDASTAGEVFTLRGHTGHVSCVGFSPEGSRIVTGSWDRTVRLWDAKTGASLLTLRMAQHGIDAATFSPDGSRLLVAWGGLGGAAQVWDAAPVNRAFQPEPKK